MSLPGVVIVTYNEAAILRETLSALVEQFQEIIVVDNVSKDETVSICEGLPVTLIRLSQPLSRGQCWNQGAALIQSDTILFLHADVMLPSPAIQRWKQVWEKNEWDYSCFQIRFPESSFRFRLIEWCSNTRSRYLRVIYGDQGLCVKKSVFEEIQGFPEEYLLEDLKISQRLRPFRFVYLNSTIHPSSRKFHQLGYWRYLFLMLKILILNGVGVPTEKLREVYYRK
jgi:glycosyltransferase involved in cell wall biosynthesis